MDASSLASLIDAFLANRGLALVRRRSIGTLGEAEQRNAVRDLAEVIADATEASSGIPKNVDREVTARVPVETLDHARALCRDEAPVISRKRTKTEILPNVPPSIPEGGAVPFVSRTSSEDIESALLSIVSSEFAGSQETL